MIKNIVIIGAGNVATHLSKALHDKGFTISGIASARGVSARILADKLSVPTVKLEDIPADTDLVLIATNDSSVEDVAASIPEIHGIVAHTSGSVPLSILSAHHKHAAVLYPLQTFSKDVSVDVSEVPFFIEATDKETHENIKSLASAISKRVHEADSSVRSVLHIAGVFSSNFPICLLQIVKNLLLEVNLPFDTVQPLVEATIAKAFDVGPEAAMTGPARRGDIPTIDKQESKLRGEDFEIYKHITNKILECYHPELMKRRRSYE